MTGWPLSFVASVALALLLRLKLASGTEGYLQWQLGGNYMNFPTSSTAPPNVSPPASDGSSVLVLFTNYSSTDSTWTLSGLDTATGQSNWTLSIVAPSANDQPGPLNSALPPGPQLSNYLSLAFFLLGGQLYAVDPQTGRLAWTHSPYNGSAPIVTGWSDALSSVVYLTSTFWDANRPVPVNINVVEALDPATGSLLWRNNTAVPLPSGLPQSNTATTSGVTAIPNLAVYAQAARVAAMRASNGSQAWSFAVGGTGFGGGLSNANITSVAFVEPAPSPASVSASSLVGGASASAQNASGASPGSLLLTNTVFQTVRFVMYGLNGSLAVPPSLVWQMSQNNDFEGALSDELILAGMQQPVVSSVDGLFYFWSNRTVYNQTTGAPSYILTLVARNLADGKQAWARDMTGLTVPYVKNGRLYVTTPDGLQVLDAKGGQTLWGISQPPADPISGSSGQYGYTPAAAFDSTQGQLALMRCLGSGAQPNSVCAYSGFAAAPPAITSGAAGGRAAASAVTAAAAALAAAAWLL